jgi:hypothetical protein
LDRHAPSLDIVKGTVNSDGIEEVKAGQLAVKVVVDLCEVAGPFKVMVSSGLKKVTSANGVFMESFKW